MKKYLGITLIASFIIISMLVQFTPISTTAEVNTIQQITHNITHNDTKPIIQVDSEDNIHLIWNSFEYFVSFYFYQLSYLSNKGAGETADLENSLTFEDYRNFAVDSNGTIHLTMCSLGGGSDSDIFYTNTSNGYFDPINNITSDSTIQMENKIVIDENNKIHIIYNDLNNNINYVNTLGGWFGAPLIVNTGTTANNEIGLAVDSNSKVHITWKNSESGNDEIYYSNNILGAFLQPVNISSDNKFNDSKPAISIDSQDNIHFTWIKGNTFSEIYYAYYITSNGTLRTPVNITKTPTLNDNNPVICVDSKSITHIAYTGNTTTGFEIYYLNNSEGTFDTPKAITNNLYDDINPSIATDSHNNIHLVWETWINNLADIYYTTLIVPTPSNTTTDNNGIPAFEFIPIFIGIIFVFFWKIQKKKTPIP